MASTVVGMEDWGPMRPLEQRTDGTNGALAACVLSLLEEEWDGSPGDAPLARWQEWLAARNLRAVAPAELPGSGFWIAAVERDGAPHHVVMFGAPPDVVHDPAGNGAALGAPQAALVLAPLDPRSRPERCRVRRGRPARSRASTSPRRRRRRARRSRPPRRWPVAGFAATATSKARGTFGSPGDTGHELTLIEAEALEALAAGTGIALDPPTPGATS